MDLIPFCIVFALVLGVITFMWIRIVISLDWRTNTVKQGFHFIINNFVMYCVVVLQSITVTILLNNINGW